MAYDGVNNAFNLAYELLGWKVHKAKLSTYLTPTKGDSIRDPPIGVYPLIMK